MANTEAIPTNRTDYIEYYPLQTSTAFRIVVLAHGQPSDAVQCLLLHSNPGEIPYDALSYEWGYPHDDDPFISIDGRQIRIRSNLLDCLKHIRFEDEDRYIWIDALCINQSNAEERTQQVEMMGQIYREAESVVVWLGPERDGSGFVMEALKNPASLKKKSQQFSAAQFDAILAFCRRSYWRRVWVQQEMYLAQHYTVHCGSKSISNEDLDQSLGELLAPPQSDYEPEIGKSPACAVVMRRRIRSMGTDLFGWLKTCINMGVETSEPRDFIYALLSVSSDCQNGEIIPDYTKPMSHLYHETMQLCEKTRNARGRRLSRLGLRPVLAQKLGLPFEEEMEEQQQQQVPETPTPKRKKKKKRHPKRL